MEHNASNDAHMSRRERRETMRSQRGSNSLRQSPSRMLRRMLIWGGSLVAIGLIGWGMVELSKNAQLPVESGVLSVAVDAQDNMQGPADAEVTLTEYSDFQCPACAAFVPVIAKAFAEPELKGKIRLAYRYFPLSIHPNAQLASQAGQAAALQGKFWEMHDVLFEKQDIWSPLSSKAARDAFVGYAQQLGLDTGRFLSDIDNAAVKDRVKTDVDSGTASDVNSTPSFFVNGVRMTHPQSYEEFKQNLINALDANK
ncbi:MAG: thioredoxin domain-containing protein [Patescibacteria group bacterium]